MRMWNVGTGKELFKWETKAGVRSVAFSNGDEMVCFVTDATMGQSSTVHIVPIAKDTKLRTLRNLFILYMHVEKDNTLLQIVIKGSKATIARWGKFNRTIITGHEDGTITIWDAKVNILICNVFLTWPSCIDWKTNTKCQKTQRRNY